MRRNRRGYRAKQDNSQMPLGLLASNGRLMILADDESEKTIGYIEQPLFITERGDTCESCTGKS